MPILKLKNAGDEATLTVASCEAVQGQYGEQVKITSDEGDDLYIPKDSFDRQAERIGLDGPAAAVGQRLHISRTASGKPGINYWNINTTKKNGAVKPTATPEKPRLTSNVPEKDLPPDLRNTAVEETAALHEKIGFDRSKIETTLSLYQGIAEWGARELPKIFESGKNPVGITPETLAACINTIFINTAGKK